MVTKRMLAYVLTLVMVFSCVIGTQPIEAKAAAKKYVKSMSVSGKVSMKVGEKKTVKVKVKVSGKADKKVKVKSSNKKIVKASYSSKKSTITLTGVKPGTANVTVTTKGKNKKGKTIKKTIKVTVNNKGDNSAVTPTTPTTPATPTTPVTPTPSNTTPSPTPTIIKANKITISNTALEMYKGDKTKLTATITPDNTADKTLKWTSSKSDIVSVDTEGNIVALKKGTADITVTNPASNLSATCNVTVKTIATITSQSELESILEEGADKIELNVPEGEEITIPKGNYSDTTIIIKENGGTVNNNGSFNSVTIAGTGKYVEGANNNILVSAPSDIKVNDDATVSITIDLDENAEKRDVVIDSEGQVTDLNISSGANVKFIGESDSSKPVNVNISSEDVKLVTNHEAKVSVTAKADITFTGETENTTVTVDDEKNMPSISGNGYIEVTNSSTGEKTVVIAEPSEEMGVLDIKGSVLKAVDKSALEGVEIHLVAASKYKGDTTAAEDIKIVTSDSEGNYIFDEVPGGNYYLTMKKEGYKDAIQLLAAASKYNSEYVNEPMWMLPADVVDENNASIRGVVNDASNKNAIKGITVELRVNKGNIIGEAAFTQTTNENGEYSFEGLSAEQYTIRVLDNRNNVDEKYISKYVNKCVQAGTDNTQNITMSRPVKGTGVRFVLSWGDKDSGAPEDLDSHLLGPVHGTDEYKMHEVYYGEKIYGERNNIYSSLDVDETEYSGPETTTIVKPINGIYYFYVYNYSGSPNLQSSLAQVDVYSGSELLTTYNVPTGSDSEGCWWKVCCYNSVTQEITSYNTIEERVIIDGIDYCEDVEGEKDGSGFSKCQHGFITGLNRVTLDGEEIRYIKPSYDTASQSVVNGTINIYTEDTWDSISNRVVFDTIDGYEYKFYSLGNSNGKVGYIILKKTETGDEICRYDIFCNKMINVSASGDITKQNYYHLDGELYIYTIDDPTEEEVKSWHFTCSDPEVEVSLDSYDEEEGEGKILLKYDDGSEATVWMYVYTGRFIVNASYGNDVVEFYEDGGRINLTLADPSTFDSSQLSFVVSDGYQAFYEETQEYDEEDDSYWIRRSIVIKDAQGEKVCEKSLYIYSPDDYDD